MITCWGLDALTADMLDASVGANKTMMIIFFFFGIWLFGYEEIQLLYLGPMLLWEFFCK